MRTLRSLVAAAIFASTLLLGTGTASACSCVESTDAELLDAVDVVFRGTLIDYEFVEDPDGDGEWSSSDPATYTFAVSEVLKGTATETQRVLSPVDGASCGLEIPHEGEFIVLAQAVLWDGPALAEGDLAAYLCDGTRPASAGFEHDLQPYPPDPNPATVSGGAAAPDSGAQDLVDQTTSDTGVVAVVGFFLVCIIGVLAARQFRRTRG